MEIEPDVRRKMADIVLKLKHQFQKCLSAEAHYSENPRLAREIDTMGGLIKELEDLVVIADVRAGDDTR